MYASEEIPGQQSHRWVGFRVRFTNERVQDVHGIPTQEGSATQPADSDALLADVPGKPQAPGMACAEPVSSAAPTRQGGSEVFFVTPGNASAQRSVPVPRAVLSHGAFL